VGRVDDLEAKPGDNLDSVIIRRNRNRQDGLDDRVVVVRDAVEPGEGEIATDHDEAAAALHEVGHHLAAVRSQWVRVGRGEPGVEDHRVVADVAENHDVVARQLVVGRRELVGDSGRDDVPQLDIGLALQSLS
jgi:hypothetical protein